MKRTRKESSKLICIYKTLKSSFSVLSTFLVSRHIAGNWPKSSPLGVYIPVKQIESTQRNSCMWYLVVTTMNKNKGGVFYASPSLSFLRNGLL